MTDSGLSIINLWLTERTDVFGLATSPSRLRTVGETPAEITVVLSGEKKTLFVSFDVRSRYQPSGSLREMLACWETNKLRLVLAYLALERKIKQREWLQQRRQKERRPYLQLDIIGRICKTGGHGRRQVIILGWGSALSNNEGGRSQLALGAGGVEASVGGSMAIGSELGAGGRGYNIQGSGYKYDSCGAGGDCSGYCHFTFKTGQ